ncbi:hypothetical protein KSP39_PZI022733 [Platanthera zijinensis]|uniref:Protein LOW PSII ACCUMULATION 2, chloroplastic n=1 Tax=Platanthera zijinensis TaxID=2320716 RepID=A0AAP0AUJ1_9ASPA
MESAASLIGVQLQPPSASHRPFFKRDLSLSLFLSTSHPSFHFISLPISISSSPAGRGTSFLTRAAEPSEGIEIPNSADLSSSAPPPPKKSGGSGSGFGSAADARKKSKVRERSAVIRRSPVDRPSVLSPPGGQSRSSQGQQGAGEGVFLLFWVGLGILILMEGIALAVSGFLPEQWDNILAKYLYPSFTPTCGVFIGGTVVYGVLKYLQAERRTKS